MFVEEDWSLRRKEGACGVVEGAVVAVSTSSNGLNFDSSFSNNACCMLTPNELRNITYYFQGGLDDPLDL